MPTCSFCKKIYTLPRGLTLFTSDGRSIFYCSSKCRKNHALGRDSKKIKWINKEKRNLKGMESLEKSKENFEKYEIKNFNSSFSEKTSEIGK